MEFEYIIESFFLENQLHIKELEKFLKEKGKKGFELAHILPLERVIGAGLKYMIILEKMI